MTTTDKLGNLANIRSGLVLSRKEARAPSGNRIRYELLNLRSVNPAGHIDLTQTDIFESTEKLSPEYLTQKGDVIIRMSEPYTAVYIDEGKEGMVISSYFVIIRCDKRKLLPEFLYWLLNTDKEKRKIYKNAGNNMLGSVNAKYFAQLKVNVPDIAEQKKIADMYGLAVTEVKLLRRLAGKKERLYGHLIQEKYEEMIKR